MRKRRGQGIVEFALLIPVLLFIILGIVEVSLVIQGFLTVQHAARESTRFAATYQPIQGACIDADGDGHLADGIDVGNDDSDDLAAYPDCPYDNMAYAAESDDHYYERRAVLIKQVARDAATGLRIDDAHLGDTELEFSQYEDEAGFFGVHLWGYPSFETNCNANPSLCIDHPGLEGLPVRVLVVHNIPIIDPFYQAIAKYITVYGDSQMINEGVQVGFGDMPPPHFDTNPHFGDPEVTPEDTLVVTPEDTSEPTPEPTDYRLTLNIDHITNTLPNDRAHNFTATVIDNQGQRVEGARVSFSTDIGGFNSSGIEPKHVEEYTDSQGQATVTIYGNRPEAANIHAWLDYDADDGVDDGEPHDSATKIWVVTGPYIVVSDHAVVPLDYIYVDVMDHNSADNPHRLLWCVISGTETSTVVQDPVNVDSGTGDAANIGFEIPSNSNGAYQIESHSGSGDCGATGDMVAYSAAVSVTVVPPDLHIADISWPEEYGDELPGGVDIPFTMLVENLSPAPVQDTYFDVDYYLDPNFPPPFRGQVGNEKQWLLNIPPNGTQEVTATFNLLGGTHQLWGQVDTTDYVPDESDETNNISGPYTLTVACTVNSTPYGDDFNDGSLDGKWTDSQIGSSNVYGSLTESGGQLTIDARGGSIWGDEDNFYYVHQSISGDFDARLRILYGPDIRQYAKLGLMVRNSLSSDSRHVMLNYTNNHSYLQFAYRQADGGSTSRFSSDTWAPHPIWVRIVRSGDTFGYYYSTQSDPGSSDWTYQGGVDIDMDGTVQVGINHASYTTYSGDDGAIDEFVICLPQSGSSGEELKPPGMKECQQVLHVGDFEGNPDRVFSYWSAGGSNAYQHQSRYFYDGSMSMRLHASMGSYPNCPSLSPYLRQTVEIPTEVYTMTTMVVQGERLVAGSLAPCSYQNSAEADDVLHLQIRDGSGSNVGSPFTIVDGSASTGNWSALQTDVTSVFSPYDHAGEEAQIYFYATHDSDYYDTWFYLDALECQVCTEWPVPDDEAGTASIGGELRVLVGGVLKAEQGVDVWAYDQGGEVYHTVTIQDGTYHFYNIPPGTYSVYSEFWTSGGLRTAMTTVTVEANERNYDVNLPLL